MSNLKQKTEEQYMAEAADAADEKANKEKIDADTPPETKSENKEPKKDEKTEGEG